MESVVVGIAFAALFAVWWVKKAEWSRHETGAEPRPRSAFAPTPAVPPPALAGTEPPATFRPDIEGLRAIAVLLVLVYHAKFSIASGGLIGVDVFFVLSGFLITSLLLRELSTTGTISLSNFWARRARRLLPASGLVLVATLLASRFTMDFLSQADLGHDAIAASLFVVNIRFWQTGVDYLSQGKPESPLLHFWSLAVEEQFYMVWPGLLLLLVRFARVRRRVLGALIGLIWLVSLVVCIQLTYGGFEQHNWAFFMLPARAWELLTGAGLAFVAGRLPSAQRLSAAVRQAIAVLAWLSVGAIFVMAVVYVQDQPFFPGFVVAIPVVATLLVVLCGTLGIGEGPVLVLRARPLQWVGARSYAIYLWHFPMLVLAGHQWGRGHLVEGLSVVARLAVLAASLVLAEVSHRFVENPVRFSPSLAKVPVRSLVMGAWVALIGIGAANLLIANPPSLSAAGDAAEVTLAQATTTAVPTTEPGTTVAALPGDSTTSTAATTTTTAPPVADASRDNPPELAALIAANLPTLQEAVNTGKVPGNLSPSLGNAANDLPQIYDNGCILDVGDNQPKQCIYGDANGSVTVVLFGDSHAAEWMPAMHQVAAENGWRLIIHTKKACPSAEIPTDKDPNGTDCMVWRERVIALIGEMHPDLVVMSSYRYKQVGAAAGRDPDQVWKEGIDLTVSKVRPLADHVLLLGDTPTPIDEFVPNCLAGNLSNVPRCMNSRDGAVRPGRLAVEREVADTYDAAFIPTSDWLCTDTACPVIVGNTLMYRDNSHITASAALLLAPYVEAALKSAMA
ncbi:MAG: acyltransferase family protein [Actinomycetota bacterium]|nr:acyltransferase family protein [Actinomycetota bacterium]